MTPAPTCQARTNHQRAERARRVDADYRVVPRADGGLDHHTALREVLERIPRHVDGRIFHGPRGGVIKPDTVRNFLLSRVLKPLAKELLSVAKKLPPRDRAEASFIDGRLHSFRHYFCSECADSGVPEQMLMTWLGHQNSAMVRHYYHLNDELAQSHMKRLRLVNAGGSVAGGNGKVGK